MALIVATLFSYFGMVFSGQAVVVENTVYAKMGESVVLPCTYSTKPGQGFLLEWQFAKLGTSLIQAQKVIYFNGKVYWVNSWESQAVFIQNPPVQGTASIRILNVQPSNTGIYICEVTNPSDWSGSGQGLINFTVLMPPSTPNCKLNGNPYAGSDVILTCKASQGVPTPIYSWSREKDAPPVPSDNIMEDQQTGSLSLRNLSSSFSGTYTCTASNELGNTMCTVVLRVTYITNALIIGSTVMATFIVLLLLAALVAYLFIYKKRKSKLTQENQELRTKHKNPEVDPEGYPLNSIEERPASRSSSHHHRLGPSKPSILV
ncbi:V-set and immunoglobulin domain-containing protein 2-like [Arapaima gigas]